ncbi:Hpt domain-containing protein [Pseudohalocynthiibacter aestuariivivens]|nr:Hpt domain-containing protein [Pseudohalocynthiibacter aestuariivivens]QIE46136.1 Hpt domain-containing protein [Pseudohalocynthiibacter aestuariivivens]
MIDWSRVAELHDEIGAEDFGDVVELFLEEVQEEIGKLRAGEPPKEWEAMLHFLKGSALNLGFLHFSDLCQTGETAAAHAEFEQINIVNILESFDASCVEFLAGLDRLHST